MTSILIFYFNRTAKGLFFAWMTFFVLMGTPLQAQVGQVPTASGVTQVSPYNGQVNLYWTPNPTATAYSVSRELFDSPTATPTGTWTPLPTDTPVAWIPYSTANVPAQTPIMSDGQVTDGRVYLYSISGMDSSGLMGLSASVTASSYTVPNFIVPTVQNIHNNSLDLSWSIPLSTYPIDHYNVYRQTSAQTPAGTAGMPISMFFTAVPTITPIATVVGTAYSDPGAAVPNATAVYYSVIAVDSMNHQGSEPVTGFSSTGSFPTNFLPPVQPTLNALVPNLATITATPYATVVYGVQLFWNGPLPAESVTEYQVLANQTQIATVMVSPTVSPTYSYMDTPLPQSNGSAPITYSVVAVNTYGTVTTNLVNEEIIRPSASGIQVTPNATTNSVAISWGAASGGTYGVQGYYVYQGNSGAPPVPYLATATGTLTITPTLTPSPFIRIFETPSKTPTLGVIQTTNNANGTYWVAPIGIVVPASGSPITVLGDNSYLTEPLAPTPVTTVLVNQVSNTTVNVTWGGANNGFYGNIKNYVIYAVFGAGTPTAVATVSASKSTRNAYINGVSGPVSYAVGAADSLGNISDLLVFSSPVTLTGLVTPEMPKILPSTQTANGLTFNWILNPASDNVQSYQVFGGNYYSSLTTTTATPQPIITISAPATPVMTIVGIPALWSQTTYYLEAVNSQGSSQPATMSAIAVPTYAITVVIPAGSQSVSVLWGATPTSSVTPVIDSMVIYRMPATPQATQSYFRPIATVGVSTPSYVDAVPSPGTSYNYMVTGRMNNAQETPLAESPVSVFGISPANIMTWPNVPPVPVVNAGAGAVTLLLTPNSASDKVQSYVILRNGIPTAVITPVANMTMVFTETPGSIVSYQVAANNVGGASASTSPVSVLMIPTATPVIALTPIQFYELTPTITPGVNISLSANSFSATVVDFTLYRSTDPTFATANTTMIGTLNSGATSIFDTSYVAGAVNYYKWVADSGSAGVTANFTLSAVLGVDLWPNAPNFTARAGSNAVTLNWTPPFGNAPVTGYNVFRSTVPNALTPYGTATPVTSVNRTYVDAQVTAGIPYYYYMNAVASGIPGAPTSEAGVITGPPLALSAGSGVSQGILTWAPVTQVFTPGYSSFVVSRIAMATPQSAVSVSTYTVPTVTISAYTDNTTTYSTGYAYQVAPVAVATTGETICGPYSNSVTIVVPPQGPSTLSAVSGDQLAQLRWSYQGTAALGAYTYTIQRKLGTAPSSAFQPIVSKLTGLDYTDTGLLDKTLYNYQILSIDPNTSQIGYSPIANALPAKPPVIDNPTLTLNQTQNGNVLTWFAANNAPGDYNVATMYPLGGYHVYRSSDGGGTYQLLNPQGTTATSYTDNVSIINGNSYVYLVRAYDAPPNVNTGDPNMVHESLYSTVTANGLTASTALDRNSIRPYRNNAGDSPVVNIRFVVTNPGVVTIKVYSLSGTFIKQLISQYFGIGIYGVGGNTNLQWDGRNTNGDMVASGVYLITTEMNGHQEIDKVAVIK